MLQGSALTQLCCVLSLHLPLPIYPQHHGAHPTSAPSWWALGSPLFSAPPQHKLVLTHLQSAAPARLGAGETNQWEARSLGSPSGIHAAPLGLSALSPFIHPDRYRDLRQPDLLKSQYVQSCYGNTRAPAGASLGKAGGSGKHMVRRGKISPEMHESGSSGSTSPLLAPSRQPSITNPPINHPRKSWWGICNP